MRPRPRDNQRFIAEANITSLVDVMLVILIIFIVTAPMMLQGVEVDLPRTTTKPLKERSDPLILTIRKNQEMSLNKYTVQIKDLEEKVANIFANRREKEILLRADKEVPYGFVIEALAAVRRGGVENIGMITAPADQK